MTTALRLLCVVGATGTGKTAAALGLARALHGGVVNFDSRQVYTDLAVVTAQPTDAEKRVCPHLLYGYLPVSEPVQAGAFAQEVLTAARLLQSQGMLPILVGGTGLYLRSLLEGLAPIPAIDAAVRERIVKDCHELGSVVMYSRLCGIDPDYAQKIHPRDPQRICRALEVFEATGETLTTWHGRTERPVGLHVLKLGLKTELDALKPRLARRIELMLDQGVLQEVERAHALYPQRQAPGFSGIGCPELLSVLLDGAPLQEAKAAWLRNTRAYAKRQLTWFRKDQDIGWFDPDDVASMVARAQGFLTGD